MFEPLQTPRPTRCPPALLRLGAVLLLGGTLGFHPWRALGQRPLGTDVSGYQPSINWTTVKNGGVSFAWAKATEGTSYTNPYFTAQEAGAQSVGIYIGAYHFARPSSHPNITGANSAESEAAYFWSVTSNYVKYGGAFLVPMLDWEDSRVTNQLSATTMSSWVNQWCNTVSNYARAKGVLGVKPVIYTGAWYSRPSSVYSGLTTAVTNWPCWIAAYPSNPKPQTGGPSDTYPWPTWNIWQYADTNWSGGDSDVFNGTLSKFVQMFVIGGTNAPVITAGPTNLAVALGASATFSVKASGLAPLSFLWSFNGALISGATGSSYTLAAAQLTNAGSFAVVVTNSYGSIASTSAFLSVLGPLTNTAGCVVAPAGMVDWWPADGNPKDIFGSYDATPYYGFSYAAGKQGLAFHFDGTTGYLAVPGAASIPVPWTACCWVNRQNAPGTGAALMGDGTYELKLEQYNGTRQVGITQFGVGDYSFGYVTPVGVWTHLAFVGTSAGTSLYVNGAFRASLTNTLPLPRGYIGAGYVTSSSKLVDYMLGNLDEILLFNRALNGSEIAAIYGAGNAGLVRAPEFTAMAPAGFNQLQLALRAQTGKSLSIYRSLDLTAWTRLATGVANPAGTLTWVDSAATNMQSFYRLSQP